LVITNGDWTTRQEIGETDIVIGRDPNCDLFFVNQKLSRRHARVEPGPDGVRLVDLGSRNGVWVNERKIDRHLLAPGDTIRLGGLRIVFEEEDSDPSLEHDGPDTTVLEGVDATVALSGPALATIAFRPATPAKPEEPAKPVREDASRSQERDSESPEGTVVLSGAPAQTVDISARVREHLSAWPWSSKFSTTIFGLSVLMGGLLVMLVRAGSWVAGVLFGLLFASLLAGLATVLARRLLVEPVARLGRDAEALGNGGSLSLGREYPELEKLAKSVNRLTEGDPETVREERTHGAS
jgi:pSer/pThr/pTyr-binding forkhead associated (FHA) protein